jgi:hypothetical protein
MLQGHLGYAHTLADASRREAALLLTSIRFNMSKFHNRGRSAALSCPPCTVKGDLREEGRFGDADADSRW